MMLSRMHAVVRFITITTSFPSFDVDADADVDIDAATDNDADD